MKKTFILVFLVVMSSLSTAQIEILGPDNSNVINLQTPTPDINSSGGGGGNSTIDNSTILSLIIQNAWLLNGSNSPPSNDWNMSGFDFDEVGRVTFDDNVVLIDSANFFQTSMSGNQTFRLRWSSTTTDPVLQIFTSDSDNTETIRMTRLTSSEDLLFDWVESRWEFEDDLYVQLSLNVSGNIYGNGDITSIGFFIGNGSKLTDVCLSNGTSCPNLSSSSSSFNNTNIAYLNNTQTFTGNNTFQYVFAQNLCYSNGTNCVASSSFNNTNIAYLNNTQNFTVNQTFNQNILVEGNITGRNNIVRLGQNNNLTLQGTKPCIFFKEPTTSFVDQTLCFTALITTFTGTQIIMAYQTITFGKGDASTVSIGIDTSGTDTTLAYDGANSYWEFKRPISWDVLAGGVPVIIPSNFAPTTNITFDPIFGDDAYYNNINLFVNANLNFSGNINGCTATQVVMGDGTCRENNTIGMEATSSGSSDTTFRTTDIQVNTTTYVNDTQLTTSVTSGRNYSFDIYLHIQGGHISSNIWFNITRPSGEIKVFQETEDGASGFMRLVCDNYDLNNMPELGGDGCGDGNPFFTQGGDYTAHFSGIYSPNASGTVMMAYREDATGASDSTVNKFSYMKFEEI